MAKRQSISKKTRFEVFKRDSFTCQYCGNAAPTVVLNVDHIQPVSKGGTVDLLNLITSCFDCNMGKKDRLLSDDSVVQKQKAQLDELNTRREQLEMMVAWRQGLTSLQDDEVSIWNEEWNSATGYWANEAGTRTLRTWIKKFGLPMCLDAIERAASSYLRHDNSGTVTQESAEIAFNKIGGICAVMNEPQWKQDLRYLKNILRKRLSYCKDWQLMKWLEDLHRIDGFTPEQLRSEFNGMTSWTAIREHVCRLSGGRDG